MSTNITQLISSIEEHSFDTIISTLQTLDDNYYNGDASLATDDQYDILRRYAYSIQPAHVYFTGVGSSVRGGKIKLPFTMGSLNQIHEGELEAWLLKWSHSLTAKSLFVVTEKLDGTSCMVVYDHNGDLQIAYSRGDGVNGADITRHLSKMPSVPKKLSTDGSTVVRGEIIISKSNFKIVQKLVKSRSGSDYKNARNAVAGLMNAELNNEKVYDYIDFIAYDIVNDHDTNKIEMHRVLDENGFILPKTTIINKEEMTEDFLTEILNRMRVESNYEIDGIVVDVDNATTRCLMNPTSSTLNPAYSFKYKVASADNVKNVRVVDVVWKVSKHGYLKPRVQIDPTELMGVTIEFCTGFNAKYIYDNKIQPGSIIKITRSGDVIPLCLGVVQSGPLK